jgi:hypothetical protein
MLTGMLYEFQKPMKRSAFNRPTIVAYKYKKHIKEQEMFIKFRLKLLRQEAILGTQALMGMSSE